MNLRKIGLKRLDTYIMGKFLGTFVFSIVLILSIGVVFDITEKLDDFYEHNAPFRSIVVDYYLSFIPYYAYLFTPLFTFISVIFFTSKMANNTEIVAILSSGVSFRRLMKPYMLSALVITSFAFVLGAFVIPKSTEKMIDFEHTYIKPERKTVSARNVQLMVDKGKVLYIERYEINENLGYRISLEEFEEKTLISRLTAETARWDSTHSWTLNNYTLREFSGMHENMTHGSQMQQKIPVDPKEFYVTSAEAPQLSLTELRTHIKRLKSRGVGNYQAFEDEYYRRFSTSISALIMTLIGISLSSRKVRGGMGINLGIGLGLSSMYVLFTTLSTTFAVNGVMPTLLAVWLPNITFFTIAVFLYLRAPK